jgi:tight adherence protein C
MWRKFNMSIGLVSFFSALAVLATFYAIFSPTNKKVLKTLPAVDMANLTWFDKWIRPAVRNFLPQAPLALTAYARKNGTVAAVLARSGNPWRVTPEEYIIVRTLATIAGIIFGLFIATLGYIDINPFMIAGFGGLVGLVLPKSLLSSAWAKRRRDLDTTLPEALDLMRIALDAGYNFNNALQQTIELLSSGPTRNELARVNNELKAGRSLSIALTGFSYRCPTDGVEAFVRVIHQSQATGVDIASTLAFQADEARAEYERNVDVKAQKMQTTLFFPIIGLLLPVLVILMFAPSVANLQGAF